MDSFTLNALKIIIITYFFVHYCTSIEILNVNHEIKVLVFIFIILLSMSKPFLTITEVIILEQVNNTLETELGNFEPTLNYALP